MNTQSEAKRFFATKTIERARTEGVVLSDAERRMLYWAESDPEFKADPTLVEQLASEMSDEDYEAKIAALLKNALAADSAIDSGAPQVWRKARSVLEQGDHYRHLADLTDYARAHRQVAALYADPEAWSRKAIINVACSGRFSSDRTIREYAEDIWHLRVSTVE